jgi:hypothetical protein
VKINTVKTIHRKAINLNDYSFDMRKPLLSPLRNVSQRPLQKNLLFKISHVIKSRSPSPPNYVDLKCEFKSKMELCFKKND